MIDDSRSFLSYTFSLLRVSWQRKRRFVFFPPLYIIIILPVRGYRGYSTRLKKEKQILDNNLKINNSIARRDYSISKYSIDIVTYHFEEWKKCRITFLSLEIETFFVVDPRNGGFGTSCNRNERKCVSFKTRKEYIVFAIRDERGKEWGDDERRRDERGKERGTYDRGSSITDSFFAQYFRL